MKMNKALIMGGMLGPAVLGGGMMVIGMTNSRLTELLMIGPLVNLVGLAAGLYFVHQMWSAIQDEESTVTPLAAAGLLLVPLFNFYWMFRVFPGFVDEYNAFAKRHQHNVPELPKGPYTAMVVSALLCLIPVLGALAAVAALGVTAYVVHTTCDAVNAIAAEDKAAGLAPQAA